MTVLESRSVLGDTAIHRPPSTPWQYIDVSGLGNSGKTAAVDFLAEIDGVHTPPYWFEFDFLRISGGLLDLRHALTEDWSPVRSHDALRRFVETADKMGLDPAWWDIRGLLTSSSQRYDKTFGHIFTQQARRFAEAFVRAKYVAEWPYDDLREPGAMRFIRKTARKLGFRNSLRREVLIADGRDFDARARHFIDMVYGQIVGAGVDTVVLNNALEPFNPGPGLNMLAPAKQIVVTRDPRDVYVSGMNAHAIQSADRGLMAVDNDGLNKSFLATDDLAVFIERQRVYLERFSGRGDDRVFVMRFEDFIYDYDRQAASLLDFLGIAPQRHARARTRFDPSKSAKNVGIWRNFSRQADVDAIAKALPQALYEGQ